MLLLEHKFFSTHDKANFLLAELPCNIFFFEVTTKRLLCIHTDQNSTVLWCLGI